MIDVSEEVPEDEVKALLAEAGVNSNPRVGLKDPEYT